MPEVDLLVHSARQLVTCASQGVAKRGRALSDVGIILGGAVAVSDGVIVDVGASCDLQAAYSAREQVDASGKVVCPGWIDSHTHAVFMGERIEEFELKLQGASYTEILKAGGGILHTMQATRRASVEELVSEALPRLQRMLEWGSTTVEIKTGYGLDVAGELKMLEAIQRLHRAHPIDCVPTFLGAHAVPPEFLGDADGYVDLVVSEMIPTAAEWYQGSVFAREHIPIYCDVFCEAGVFDRTQSERVLLAGLENGLGVKVHADEFENLGGVSLACELGAVSVDHLDVTPGDEISRLARSDTVGVVLPVVNFNLGSCRFADARRMIEAGVAVALATDFNPGSAPCLSMPLAMAIGCRYQRLLPSESMNAATLNAAFALGMQKKMGSLEVGKQADILVLKCPDYRYPVYEFGTNFVETVIKAGRPVRRD